MRRWSLAALAICFAIACGDKEEDTANLEADTDTDTDSDTDTDTDSDSDTDTDADADTDTDTDTSPTTTKCSPDNANFSGTSIPQAGVEFDPANKSCSTVSGLPGGDKLVLDEFSQDVFGGSGSTTSVVSISHGSFANKSGFYLLKGLPVNTDISLTLQEDGFGPYTVLFTIEPGNPSVLRTLGVNF